METLKLTALTVLIPVVSLMSEAAAAYPEPVDQIEIAGDSSREASCFSKKMSQPELEAQDDKSNSLPESVASHIVPTGTSLLHHGRRNQVHICHLDLDLIETD